MKNTVAIMFFCFLGVLTYAQKTKFVIFNLETSDGIFSREMYKEQSKKFMDVFGKDNELVLLIPERADAHLAYSPEGCQLLLDSVYRFQGMTASPDWEKQLKQLLRFPGLEKAIANGDGIEVYVLSNTYSSSIEQRSLSYARDLMLLLEMCENGIVLPQNKVELRLAFAREEEKQVELTNLITEEK